MHYSVTLLLCWFSDYKTLFEIFRYGFLSKDLVILLLLPTFLQFLSSLLWRLYFLDFSTSLQLNWSKYPLQIFGLPWFFCWMRALKTFKIFCNILNYQYLINPSVFYHSNEFFQRRTCKNFKKLVHPGWISQVPRKIAL